MNTRILVTTYNRPDALARSLPQIAALGAPVLVIDDGSRQDDGTDQENFIITVANKASCLYIPENRGLAAAMNIGLCYWLADGSAEWIGYFQDDVDVHPKCLEILAGLQSEGSVFTGHDAGEHREHENGFRAGIPVKYKWNARATHIHASAAFWREFLPIPTRELGAPKRRGPARGLGSNVDWWIFRHAPNSCARTGRPIICVPGLVRSFLWRAEDSSWHNEQRTGEDGPLGSFA